VVDALDESRSELKRFRSGRIMRVLRYEFDPRHFRDAVREHELTGLAWDRCLWTGD
jgi:hypothetical protein